MEVIKDPEPGAPRATIVVHRWWQCDQVIHAEDRPEWGCAPFKLLRGLCKSWDTRVTEMRATTTRCVVTIRKARSRPATLECGYETLEQNGQLLDLTDTFRSNAASVIDGARPFEIRKQLYFPDKRLVQFDCGKLQVLDKLLRELKSGGHRCLIFTQMTKMLDVLEHFLNLYGYTYLRLDGSTKVEERQKMMDRFNSTDRYFIFILSTRSGGVGINLTGADTVIFYDSDWNPAMDAQAQDRCHRIGQTREVHIYRLISEHTVEENILQKSRQKSEVNRMVLSEGNFTVDAFKKWGSAEVKSLFGDNAIEDGHKVSQNTACPDGGDGHTDEDGSSDAAAGCRGAEGASEPPDTNMEAKSMSEVRSAMASAEDDDDIAAATPAELESSATVEEFEEDDEFKYKTDYL